MTDRVINAKGHILVFCFPKTISMYAPRNFKFLKTSKQLPMPLGHELYKRPLTFNKTSANGLLIS